MEPLRFAERKLGWLLGLGDLNAEPVCHGYVNACRCDGCMDRARIVKDPPKRTVKQPWEQCAATGA